MISLFFICVCLIFRYEQGEFVESEMQKMTEQVKLIIETVNAKQVQLLCQFSKLLYFSLGLSPEKSCLFRVVI